MGLLYEQTNAKVNQTSLVTKPARQINVVHHLSGLAIWRCSSQLYTLICRPVARVCLVGLLIATYSTVGDFHFPIQKISYRIATTRTPAHC